MKEIENIKSKDLWPTTTYTFTINNIDNKQIKDEILRREQDGLGFRFNPIQGGGWQGDKDLLDSGTHSEFRNLKKSLLAGVNEILSQIYVDSASIKMVNSWPNVNRRGECTMPHIHEEASWTGVYYVTSTGDTSPYIKDPRLLEQMDRSHHFLKQPYTNIVRKRLFNAGEVFLFPSWMEHGVGTGVGDTIRISIACNFLIEG